MIRNQQLETYPSKPMQPCIVLWRHVIERAFLDALGVGLSSGVHNAGKNRKRDSAVRDYLRRTARVWFESPSRDFQLVCEMADWNPYWVREKVLGLFEEVGDTMVGCRERWLWERFGQRPSVKGCPGEDIGLMERVIRAETRED